MKKNSFVNREKFDRFIAEEAKKNPPVTLQKSEKKEGVAFCFSYK